MPSGLDNAFEETLQRIQSEPEDRRSLGMSALMWTSHARRPLHIKELLDALAIEDSERSLDPDNRPWQRQVLDCCFGLITLDGERSVVRLVHYSVQEYLLQHRDRIFPLGADEVLAEKCLRYLLFEDFATGSCSGKAAIMACLEEYHFYGYACRYWGRHVQAAGSDKIEQLAMEFLQKRSRVARSYQISQFVLGRKEVYWRPEEGNSCTGLHLACTFGLERIVKELLDKTNIDINVPTDMGTTALIKAAAGGNAKCVQMLLDRNAEVFEENWYGPALHCAAEAGETAAIEALLAAGLGVDSRDQHGRTALHCATASGHVNAMQLLLNKGADINATGNRAYRPLQMAVVLQFPIHMVQMLIANGADTELFDKHGLTVLHQACAMGAEEVVSLLLKHGVDVDRRNTHGCAALHWAASKGHVEILVILLENGAYIDAQTNAGATPLSFAAERGRIYIVKELLDKGASMDIANDEGLTALDFAVMKGYKGIVSALLNAKCSDETERKEEIDAATMKILERLEHSIKKPLISGASTFDCSRCGSRFPRNVSSIHLW